MVTQREIDYESINKEGQEESDLIVLSILDKAVASFGLGEAGSLVKPFIEGMYGHAELVEDVRIAVEQASVALLLYFYDDINRDDDDINYHYDFLRRHGHHYQCFTSVDYSMSDIAQHARDAYHFIVFNVNRVIEQRLEDQYMKDKAEKKASETMSRWYDKRK
jgi:hypothetical protein